MDKENVVYVHNRVLFIHKDEQNNVIFMKMGRIGNHHVKWSQTEKGKYCMLLQEMNNMNLKWWVMGGESWEGRGWKERVLRGGDYDIMIQVLHMHVWK
jgi:hypothetical protein